MNLNQSKMMKEREDATGAVDVPNLPGPSLWLRCAAPLVRRLPAGRYVVMTWLSRVPSRPFIGTIPTLGGRLRCVCDLRNELVREAYFTGKYEPQETGLLTRLVREGHVFVDVGANWGYFSLLAAKAVGRTGCVIALECDPRVYAVLELNLALNRVGCERALQVAAADVAGSVILLGYDANQSNWGLSRVVNDRLRHEGGYLYEARAAPLDRILDDFGVGTVDCVKMDIEGAEGLALEGMADGLRRHRYRSLLLELHSQQLRELGYKTADVVAMLTRNGYRGFTIDHSEAATRRAAYSIDPNPAAYLRPFDGSRALDAWPHTLWTAPEFERSFLPPAP